MGFAGNLKPLRLDVVHPDPQAYSLGIAVGAGSLPTVILSIAGFRFRYSVINQYVNARDSPFASILHQNRQRLLRLDRTLFNGEAQRGISSRCIKDN